MTRTKLYNVPVLDENSNLERGNKINYYFSENQSIEYGKALAKSEVSTRNSEVKQKNFNNQTVQNNIEKP